VGRAGGRCEWCGASDGLAVDHILPVVFGGTPTIDNGRVLCDGCHRRKHAAERNYEVVSSSGNSPPHHVLARRPATGAAGSKRRPEREWFGPFATTEEARTFMRQLVVREWQEMDARQRRGVGSCDADENLPAHA
jgi:hypothetical protein